MAPASYYDPARAAAERPDSRLDSSMALAVNALGAWLGLPDRWIGFLLAYVGLAYGCEGEFDCEDWRAGQLLPGKKKNEDAARRTVCNRVRDIRPLFEQWQRDEGQLLIEFFGVVYDQATGKNSGIRLKVHVLPVISEIRAAIDQRMREGVGLDPLKVAREEVERIASARLPGRRTFGIEREPRQASVVTLRKTIRTLGAKAIERGAEAGEDEDTAHVKNLLALIHPDPNAPSIEELDRSIVLLIAELHRRKAVEEVLHEETPDPPGTEITVPVKEECAGNSADSASVEEGGCTGTAVHPPSEPRRAYRSDVTLEAFAEKLMIPTSFLAARGVGMRRDHTGRPFLAIPFHDEDGVEVGVKQRVSLNSSDPGTPKYIWVEGAAHLYGLESLNEARRSPALVVCEGESDALTFGYAGKPCLGVSGANNYGAIRREHMEGIANVIVSVDRDAAGRAFATNLEAHLRSLGFEGAVLAVDFAATKDKDANDALRRVGGDPARFRGLFRSAMEDAVRLGACAP